MTDTTAVRAVSRVSFELFISAFVIFGLSGLDDGFVVFVCVSVCLSRVDVFAVDVVVVFACLSGGLPPSSPPEKKQKKI